MIELIRMGVESPALPSLAGQPAPRPNLNEEAPDHARVSQHVEPGMWSILADRPHDPRQALAPVRPYPTPVIGPFPENRTPGTAKEGEVQDNDGVGGPEPYVEGTVIGSEVAIQ
jgi:hypothetical protein